MNITKEQFNKLKQLDRIEYRQKKQRLDKQYSGSAIISYMELVVILTIFAFVADMWVYFRIGQFMLNVYIIRLFGFILWMGLLANILADLLGIYFYRKHKQELENEYFKVEPKSEVKK